MQQKMADRAKSHNFLAMRIISITFNFKYIIIKDGIISKHMKKNKYKNIFKLSIEKKT